MSGNSDACKIVEYLLNYPDLIPFSDENSGTISLSLLFKYRRGLDPYEYFKQIKHRLSIFELLLRYPEFDYYTEFDDFEKFNVIDLSDIDAPVANSIRDLILDVVDIVMMRRAFKIELVKYADSRDFFIYPFLLKRLLEDDRADERTFGYLEEIFVKNITDDVSKYVSDDESINKLIDDIKVERTTDPFYKLSDVFRIPENLIDVTVYKVKLLIIVYDTYDVQMKRPLTLRTVEMTNASQKEKLSALMDALNENILDERTAKLVSNDEFRKIYLTNLLRLERPQELRNVNGVSQAVVAAYTVGDVDTAMSLLPYSSLIALHEISTPAWGCK